MYIVKWFKNWIDDILSGDKTLRIMKMNYRQQTTF